MQADKQAQLESLSSRAEAEIAGLRSDVREKALEAGSNAQRLRAALQREEKLGDGADLLKEEARSCEAKLTARSHEAVSLRAAYDEERKKAAKAQELARRLQAEAASMARAITDHEVLSSSLRPKLGSTTAKVGIAQSKVTALKEEVATVETKVRHEGGVR